MRLAVSDGLAAVLEPRTRRPRSSPSQFRDDVKEQAKTEAPRPKPDPPFFAKAVLKPQRPAPAPADPPAGIHLKPLTSTGTFRLAKTTYEVAARSGFQQVLVVVDTTRSSSPISTARSFPGVIYIGNGLPRGPVPKNPRPSQMS